MPALEKLMSEQIPVILQSAWSVCTPREKQLVEQVAPPEKIFLIKYAEYLTEVYTGKELDHKTKENLINNIIDTANARIAVLSKEVNPSLTHAVVAVVLYLLSNILSNDHVKYRTQEEMMAVYPTFSDRPETEKKNLFLTANWMSILFRILPARKNKGIAMDIIPKFVEGNSAHYVTGGGQTQATRDRVFIYETEGDCKPIKRLKRKSKGKLQEEEEEEEEERKRKVVTTEGSRGRNETSRTQISINSATQPQPLTLPQSLQSSGAVRDISTSSISSLYYPLPAPFFHALPLPIPVISPRSQSSFSQAAAVIANFGQVQPELFSIASSGTDSTCSGDEQQQQKSSSSFIVSPRECYLDIDDDGTVVKKFSPRAASSVTATPSTSSPLFLGERGGRGGSSSTAASIGGRDAGGGGEVTGVSREVSRGSSSASFAPPPLTSSVSRMSSSTSVSFDLFVDAIVEEDGDQLAMLREASADSDI